MKIKCKECKRTFDLLPGSVALAGTCKSKYDERTGEWVDVVTRRDEAQ
jgi:hypothetical protein